GKSVFKAHLKAHTPLFRKSKLSGWPSKLLGGLGFFLQFCFVFHQSRTSSGKIVLDPREQFDKRLLLLFVEALECLLFRLAYGALDCADRFGSVTRQIDMSAAGICVGCSF